MLSPDFTGGMALQCQQGILAGHAVTVISDADQATTSTTDLQADIGGSGIQRIFHQFLGNRGRALHHFTGSDLVGQGFGKYPDT